MASAANSAALSERPADFPCDLKAARVIDADFLLWSEAAETGAEPADPSETEAPWEGPPEETRASETTVSGAKKELLELPPPRP